MTTRQGAGVPARIGRYRLEQRLGSGGMGEVFRAFDERLERPVALKRIRAADAAEPRMRRRFQREARAAARLNHPALAQIHDVLETEDGDWIVMELVDGEPLAQVLESGPLSPAAALPLALEIASGLAAAHAAGIVHRDLKSENVLVTRAGDAPAGAKILDFGLARPLRPSERDASLSSADGLVGTPRAMSPEQVAGGEIDHRSDLFALGTLLYEMVTGVSPFRGPGPVETLARVCTEHQDPARERAPEVPPELSDLIDRLLEKDPARRPESAGEVMTALRRIAGAATAPASAAVEDRPPAAAAENDPADDDGEPRLGGERRQVTLMCCDLVSAESSGSLDPELLYEVLPEFQRLAAETIERFGGHLGDVQGHRLTVYFGYPQAHGDDARRAARAAVEIVERSARLAARSPGEDIERAVARAGIHTGPAVVVRTAAGGRHVALGETLDLATLLQERAEPGSVVASAATRRLLADSFAVRPETAGAFEAPAYRLLAAAEAVTELTPFVARRHELELLLDRCQVAREGAGQAVLLSGEEGMGTSRLVRELRKRLAEEETGWISVRGSPFAGDPQPFQPAADLLRQLLQVGSEDPQEDQEDRLEALLREHGFPLGEAGPLFAPLLGLTPGDAHRQSFQDWRRGLLEALPALLLEVAEKQPMVLVFEELQRMDPSTLELIGRLIAQGTTAPLFLILTCQPRFQAPWGHRAHLTQLRLGPLTDQEAAALVDRLAMDRHLPAEVREEIVARADGVPLFVEALALEALESPARTGGEAAVPAVLRDRLTARLDRLGTAKEVARAAAALGRELSREELAALVPLDAATLSSEIDRLVDDEILVRQGSPGEGRYRFRHALVRDAAYASLLEEEKAWLRHRIASRRGS